jgi:hypothetical protein
MSIIRPCPDLADSTELEAGACCVQHTRSRRRAGVRLSVTVI